MTSDLQLQMGELVDPLPCMMHRQLLMTPHACCAARGGGAC